MSKIEWYIYGNPIYWDENELEWRLISTDEIVTSEVYQNLICPKCGKKPTPEGHDACLGTLKGVKFACCGHGVPCYRYVVLESGEVIYGDNIDLDQYKQ